jgi:hypothetical protein
MKTLWCKNQENPALSGKERVKGWAAVGVGGEGAGDDPLQLAEA